MKRKWTVIPVLALVQALAGQAGCGSDAAGKQVGKPAVEAPADAARMLFEKAESLVQDAGEAEKTSYAEAHALYEKAVLALEAVLKEHPDSETAKELSTGEVKVGGRTVEELRGAFLTSAKARAEAEADPLRCAFLVTESIQDMNVTEAVLKGSAKSWDDLAEETAVKYVELERFEEAMKELETIKAPYAGAAAKARVAVMLLDRGRKDEAAGLLASALDEARSLSVAYKKAAALARIASAHARAGDEKKAARVLSLARKAAEKNEVMRFRAEALAEVAVACAGCGKKSGALVLLKKAVKAAGKVEEPFFRAGALARIAAAYTAVGDMDEARDLLEEVEEVVESIGDADSRIRTLVTAAGAYLAAGSGDEAAALLDRAIEEAVGVEKPAVRAGFMTQIAERYAESGNAGKALSSLERALEAAGSVEGVQAKIRILADIAFTYAGMGTEPDEEGRTLLHGIIRLLYPLLYP